MENIFVVSVWYNPTPKLLYPYRILLCNKHHGLFSNLFATDLTKSVMQKKYDVGLIKCNNVSAIHVGMGEKIWKCLG